MNTVKKKVNKRLMADIDESKPVCENCSGVGLVWCGGRNGKPDYDHCSVCKGTGYVTTNK